MSSLALLPYQERQRHDNGMELVPKGGYNAVMSKSQAERLNLEHSNPILFTSHRRYNPLTGRWVLVSPDRLDRPWQGKVEQSVQKTLPDYDPKCYLCPGNIRASGVRNPEYRGPFVFDNDFPALTPEENTSTNCAPPPTFSPDPTEVKRLRRVARDFDLRLQRARGFCRVVCFSPQHNLSLPLMKPADIRRVVDVLAEQTRQLMSIPAIKYVQVFENRGELMGASSPHPHCQIWATDYVPSEVVIETKNQHQYFRKKGGKFLLLDYLRFELRSEERLVCQNKHFVTLVPFWAVWPYETLILPRRPVARLLDLRKDERNSLADILRRLTTRYDNLFQSPFPYSLGWHQQPVGTSHQCWLLHAHCYPPLLRSATNRKFMVGFELLAEPQRDILPELAARRLRAMSEKHYTLKCHQTT